MRILPITLSLLMIFTPAYSAYASMLPAKGQIVQIGKKGGALIKTGAGKLVKGGVIAVGYEGGKAVWAWCKKNQKKCKDKIGDAYEVICDVTSCEVERKDEENDGTCSYYQFGINGEKYKDFDNMLNTYLTSFQNRFPETLNHHWNESDVSNFKQKVFELQETGKYGTVRDSTFSFVYNRYESTVFNTQTSNIYDARYTHKSTSCDDLVYADAENNSSDKKLNDEELKQLAKKIAEKMDDDDIKNYYNTKYDDIIINNNHYYGDEINKETNIDKYCESNACNEISKEIEQDIKDKKYDIDDVNEKNCTMEENTGKYIACNMTVKNEDEDNTNNQTNETPKKEDDDKPAFCNTSDFFKEACEYFDWVDDEPSEKQDKKIDVQDEEEEKLNKDRIDINEGCPADQHISVSMPWGYSTSIEFTYKPYCDFARDLKPYMTATGAIVSMYIVGSCGRRL